MQIESFFSDLDFSILDRQVAIIGDFVLLSFGDLAGDVEKNVVGAKSAQEVEAALIDTDWQAYDGLYRGLHPIADYTLAVEAVARNNQIAVVPHPVIIGGNLETSTTTQDCCSEDSELSELITRSDGIKLMMIRRYRGRYSALPLTGALDPEHLHIRLESPVGSEALLAPGQVIGWMAYKDSIFQEEPFAAEELEVSKIAIEVDAGIDRVLYIQQTSHIPQSGLPCWRKVREPHKFGQQILVRDRTWVGSRVAPAILG